MVIARITGPIILALITTMTFELIQKRRHLEIGAKWMDVVRWLVLRKCLVEGIDLPGNEEGFIEVCSTQSDHDILDGSQFLGTCHFLTAHLSSPMKLLSNTNTKTA